MRPRLIQNEQVPHPELPPWERFQEFVGIVSKVPKGEADKGRERIGNAEVKTIRRRRDSNPQESWF